MPTFAAAEHEGVGGDDVENGARVTGCSEGEKQWRRLARAR